MDEDFCGAGRQLAFHKTEPFSHINSSKNRAYICKMYETE